MRVGVDARHLGGGRGVAHYTAALLAELARLHGEDEWVLLVPGRGALPAPAGPDPGLLAGLLARPNVTLRRHPLPGRLLYGSAALWRRPLLDRLLGGRVDVVWAPAPAPLALSDGVPFVLTVHDLSFLQRPRDFTPYERLWHRLARPDRLIERADRVIAVSRATAEALRHRFASGAGRVRVVPSGFSVPAPAPVPATATATPSYLLCVGALEPRKAPELLLAAYRRARSQGLSAELVFAGEGRLAGRLHGEGVRVLGRVGPERLDALYRGAVALVAPSWLEGFGLPPLEALARGTPAVVSDLPVYAETLGEAALRFAPGDEQGLARALLDIGGDAVLRERLVSAGAGVLAQRSWERAARQTRAVLAEVAR